jgi:hypothetical protein
MIRRIYFAHEPEFCSNGRNGHMRTVGVHLTEMPPLGNRESGCVILEPVNSKRKTGTGSLVVDSDACGEIGVFMLESFMKGASPEVRANMLARLTILCASEPDPVRLAEEAIDPAFARNAQNEVIVNERIRQEAVRQEPANRVSP